MTHDAEHDARILRERAEKLAARATQSRSRRELERLVVVEAGSSKFGFSATAVRTIAPAGVVTPLPRLPHFLLGITSIRGDILCVVDLAELRGTGRTGTHELFVVVEHARRALVVPAERLVGFRDVFEDELETKILPREAAHGFTKAVTRDLVLLIDVERLIGDARLTVRQAGAGERPDGHGA